MDICSKAFQGETTGEMVDVATNAAPKPTVRIARQLARDPLAYGDFTGLLTWFLLSMRSEGEGAQGDLDVAA